MRALPSLALPKLFDFPSCERIIVADAPSFGSFGLDSTLSSEDEGEFWATRHVLLYNGHQVVIKKDRLGLATQPGHN